VADHPQEFLDTRELAEWLGVPEYTVTREAREGRLPGRKVGRGWRFSRTAILEHFRGSDADVHGRGHAADDTEPAAQR
jgi:excisionase family DNA binding protein